ncbi:MAG TPA: FkbM family methyltransferase, partial [Gemmataceae bacterium]
MTPKRLLRRALHAAGLEVTRYPPRIPWGLNHLQDIGRLLAGVPAPTVFDVGANTGKSVFAFRGALPTCVLHSFEPSPSTFRHLEANTQGLENVWVVNAGVGSVPGAQVLIESKHSTMSSFLRPLQLPRRTVISQTEAAVVLRPAHVAERKIVGRTEVPVTTLDDYCRAAHVRGIDLLKIDTQGYELEVLRGATGLMAANAIKLIYL